MPAAPRIVPLVAVNVPVAEPVEVDAVARAVGRVDRVEGERAPLVPVTSTAGPPVALTLAVPAAATVTVPALLSRNAGVGPRVVRSGRPRSPNVVVPGGGDHG